MSSLDFKEKLVYNIQKESILICVSLFCLYTSWSNPPSPPPPPKKNTTTTPQHWKITWSSDFMEKLVYTIQKE